MEKEKNGWAVAAKAARIGDRILDVIIAIVILLALLYSALSLWDAYSVYSKASGSDLLKYKPTMQEVQSDPSFSELLQSNPDVCGWLTIDDTSIDYPLLQGDDNMEYLNKSYDGSFAITGSIFLDSMNSDDFSDIYTLVYGHHIEGKVMFGELTEFTNKQFFDQHTTGSVTSRNKKFDMEIFACVYTDAYDTQVYNPSFYTDDNTELLNHVKEKSVQYREIGIGENDKIIAMSTCDDGSTNGRVVVFGKLCEVTQ